MFNKRRAPVDEDADLIDRWERWHLAGTLQVMKDDGLDADTIAAEYPAKKQLIIAAAVRLREELAARRQS
jgi:vancomycin permeability regulator SanA